MNTTTTYGLGGPNSIYKKCMELHDLKVKTILFVCLFELTYINYNILLTVQLNNIWHGKREIVLNAVKSTDE